LTRPALRYIQLDIAQRSNFPAPAKAASDAPDEAQLCAVDMGGGGALLFARPTYR
jgi:hypothetical protein